MAFVHYLAYAISIIGIAVIVWGVLRSALSFIALERSRLRGADVDPRENLPRRQLSLYLLLGLEFLVAADIINTILKPTLEEVAILGSIVAIRTVLNYFLNLELREIK